MSVRLHYDARTNTAYLRFSAEAVVESEEVSSGVVLDNALSPTQHRSRPYFPTLPKKSIPHLPTACIIPPSLRRRAVGRCSTDAMSEVIERDALMSSANHRGKARRS
ncbi:DUF2283 domain-containing protein [Terricaulis silvestris]|uniref:DUF2283 domain-containing protein n=1 Tax=Terricaulis silvestris TaxID=2686094 RepID=UPI00131E3674